jgi:hypothetical protein
MAATDGEEDVMDVEETKAMSDTRCTLCSHPDCDRPAARAAFAALPVPGPDDVAIAAFAAARQRLEGAIAHCALKTHLCKPAKED